MSARRFAEGTTVTVESSRGEITGILTKHGVTRMAWASEPEAASPSPEGLDVERLARAQHASYERDPAVKRIEWPDLSESEQRMWINHARVVAREYAALRTPEETPHA